MDDLPHPPGLPACYVSTEGRVYTRLPSPKSRRVQWIFFRPMSAGVGQIRRVCESNKLPASENIFRKFIYGRRARGGMVHIVYRRQVLHNVVYSCAARTDELIHERI